MTGKIKVLFICHGNICRSPMAEFYMKDLVEREGVADMFYIESAATSSEELGNPVYGPARKKLAEHGISCDGKYARKMTKADYWDYDYLVCMDNRNYGNIMRIIGNDPEGKVHMLLEYANRPDDDVADPWYTRDFEKTWKDVSAGCEGLFKAIMS